MDNTLRKAAEMALPLLVAYQDYTGDSRIANKCGEAIEALRQALAQGEQKKEPTPSNVDPRVLLISDTDFTKETGNRLCDIERRLAAIETQPTEQEPVAWLHPDKKVDVVVPSNLTWFDKPIPLYTTPPSKPWVSLTDEEIAQVVGSQIDEVYLNDFRKVEAKVKEKNGF